MWPPLSGEPIQGAVGVLEHPPPSTYWPEIDRICKKYGVILISDEVICGFGRTGEWFGFETFGYEPDIVNMAKGLSSRLPADWRGRLLRQAHRALLRKRAANSITA